MTKPLEQVKSELAQTHTDNAGSISPHTTYYDFMAGFDSAISHLASVGVSGAYETSVDIGDGNELTKFIELLPVAAQIEQLKKQLAEAEKKNELYEEAAKKRGWNLESK